MVVKKHNKNNNNLEKQSYGFQGDVHLLLHSYNYIYFFIIIFQIHRRLRSFLRKRINFFFFFSKNINYVNNNNTIKSSPFHHYRLHHQHQYQQHCIYPTIIRIRIIILAVTAHHHDCIMLQNQCLVSILYNPYVGMP